MIEAFLFVMMATAVLYALHLYDRWQQHIRAWAVRRWDGDDQAHPGVLPHRLTWRVAARYNARHGYPERDVAHYVFRESLAGRTYQEQIEDMNHQIHKLTAAFTGALLPNAQRATDQMAAFAEAAMVLRPVTLRDHIVVRLDAARYTLADWSHRAGVRVDLARFWLYETKYALEELTIEARAKARDLDPVWPAVVVALILLLGALSVYWPVMR